MTKHLIALDLDGTLLNDESKLSEKTIDTINQLKALGHIVVIATGRPLIGAKEFYTTLNLDTLMINDNGGFLSNPSDTTFIAERSLIPLDVLHSLFKKTEPFIESAIFTVEQTVYAYKYNPEMELAFSGAFSNNRIEKRFDEIDVEPTGLIYAIHEKDIQRLENIINEFNRILDYRTWGVFKGVAFYEIYQKQISKASALEKVVNYYHIEPENVIAFGDGINDIEMIENAHHGVAMLNGASLVKRATPYVSEKTNQEDGVADYLIKYFNL